MFFMFHFLFSLPVQYERSSLIEIVFLIVTMVAVFLSHDKKKQKFLIYKLLNYDINISLTKLLY